MTKSSFQVATQHCGLCHYSGFSNRCTFFDDGYCPYIQSVKEIKKSSRAADETEARISVAV
ncbi:MULTISPECIES: hypothetical protein [Dehalogenimonas]|uniref:Uncharacterized protein n=2 Tax=Dehalogenimonas TaxID=670486 RepID=A0A0W0GI57_9CHLR|nr:hypothetical protein [Dehalogenimonas alkenigignens]KTB48227.1 hypothetical protein DEALK_10720 [Dehalogenimonas alkenigignens]PVV84464.1 hypothetical protein DD509_04005 [Dehalogenimonas alkenigignens]